MAQDQLSEEYRSCYTMFIVNGSIERWAKISDNCIQFDCEILNRRIEILCSQKSLLRYMGFISVLIRLHSNCYCEMLDLLPSNLMYSRLSHLNFSLAYSSSLAVELVSDKREVIDRVYRQATTARPFELHLCIHSIKLILKAK